MDSAGFASLNSDPIAKRQGNFTDSFGNKLDYNIFYEIEPRLVVHWLLLQFNIRPATLKTYWYVSLARHARTSGEENGESLYDSGGSTSASGPRVELELRERVVEFRATEERVAREMTSGREVCNCERADLRGTVGRVPACNAGGYGFESRLKEPRRCCRILSGPVKYDNCFSSRRQPMAIDKLPLGAYSVEVFRVLILFRKKITSSSDGFLSEKSRAGTVATHADPPRLPPIRQLPPAKLMSFLPEGENPTTCEPLCKPSGCRRGKAGSPTRDKIKSTNRNTEIVYGWKEHLRSNPMIPIKRCREHKINIKESECVNVDHFELSERDVTMDVYYVGSCTSMASCVASVRMRSRSYGLCATRPKTEFTRGFQTVDGRSIEPARTDEVKRGEYGAAPECKGEGNGRTTRKPVDQRHIVWHTIPTSDPATWRNEFALVGGDTPVPSALVFHCYSTFASFQLRNLDDKRRRKFLNSPRVFHLPVEYCWPTKTNRVRIPVGSLPGFSQVEIMPERRRSAAPYSPRFTLTGSQDFYVKGRAQSYSLSTPIEYFPIPGPMREKRGIERRRNAIAEKGGGGEILEENRRVASSDTIGRREWNPVRKRGNATDDTGMHIKCPHHHYARSTKLARKVFVEPYFLWDFKRGRERENAERDEETVQEGDPQVAVQASPHSGSPADDLLPVLLPAELRRRQAVLRLLLPRCDALRAFLHQDNPQAADRVQASRKGNWHLTPAEANKRMTLTRVYIGRIRQPLDGETCPGNRRRTRQMAPEREWKLTEGPLENVSTDCSVVSTTPFAFGREVAGECFWLPDIPPKLSPCTLERTAPRKLIKGIPSCVATGLATLRKHFPRPLFIRQCRHVSKVAVQRFQATAKGKSTLQQIQWKADRALVSHQDELGSILGEVAPGFSKVETYRTMSVVGGFTLIGSQDPDVKSRSNISAEIQRDMGKPASSSTMPTYERPGVTRPGIEPGSPRGSPVCPALPFRRCSILTSITLIGSQDLAVTCLHALFTHSAGNPR
ncbi:hypothetical protein PR048_007556 [Dryococelus australis]|uniref:Uncharacterized protein n=1 Tax=Dryococelus australis TaxID=614101 RepID=A0ABQ9HVI1_9NEOP|nr:hypothetical protein PR048_007556 [Dryococelus australis]